MELLSLLPSPLRGLDAALHSCRQRTLDIVLWTILAVRLVHMGYFLSQLDSIPKEPIQFATLSLIPILICLALYRRIPILARGWGFLGLGGLGQLASP